MLLLLLPTRRLIQIASCLKAEIKSKQVNQKANACPIGMRVAWHSAGTFNASDGTGGATMRFEPEASDGANAGLHIVHDLLLPVKSTFPSVSFSDIWTAAGCVAVESLGGPEVPLNLGRVDSDGSGVLENGRLPDAAQVSALNRNFSLLGENPPIMLQPLHSIRSRARRTSAMSFSAWASTTATSWR